MNANLTINDIIYVGGRKLNLFNQQFELRKREDDFTFYSISSYHDPLQNESDWLVYSCLMPGEITFVSSDNKYSAEEALLFISKHNGIGLTRDNLFMIPALFPETLKKYDSIIAPMGEEFLPSHLNGPIICPMITVVNKDRVTRGGLNYDWWWFNKEEYEKKQSFVFFKPILRKTY